MLDAIGTAMKGYAAMKLCPACRAELGRQHIKIGSIGGHARAAALTPARRKAIARKAAKVRWSK